MILLDTRALVVKVRRGSDRPIPAGGGVLQATGTWRGAKSGKPGLLFCYDDGGYTNYSVAAPVLEEFGFSGLFFLPVGFLDCPVEDQVEWARARNRRRAIRPARSVKVPETNTPA